MNAVQWHCSAAANLRAIDAALAGPGLDVEKLARRCQLRPAEIVALLSELGLEVELRPAGKRERWFYRKDVAPLFRSTAMPETRGRKRELDYAEVRSLRANGMSRREVAEKVGCTPDMVRKIDIATA